MNRADRLINHPGREMNLVNVRSSIIPATPPSKGGETSSILSCNKTMLNLTAMPLKGVRGMFKP